MSNLSVTEKRKAKRRMKTLKAQIFWGSILVGTVAFLGWLIWLGARPASGVEVPLEGSGHIADGDPVSYDSLPPSSGEHYSQPMPAGFYDEDSEEVNIAYAEGYLVHGLEHGYITFWYNCDLLSTDECTTLKAEIQSVMDKFNSFKLVAWPYSSIDSPVIMTSWGRMLAFDEFDATVARNFIDVNKSLAPEADAP